MNVEIRGRHLKISPAFREVIEHRVSSALDRFADKIRSVVVNVSDLNGPKGGIDKQCSVNITLRDRGNLIVSDVGTDMMVAVDRAAGRAKRRITRHVETHGRVYDIAS